MPNRIDSHDEDEEGFEITNDVEIVAACLSHSGREYLQVEQGRKRIWIPREAFAFDGGEAARLLKERRILLFGPGAKAKLVQQAERITRFPTIELIEGVGHQDGCYGWPDGTVFSPDGRDVPIAYTPGAVCVKVRGSLQAWQETVLPLILGQFLPLFAVFAAFAAALLGLTPIQGNFLLMYSGPPRKGKSTLLDIAASLCGPATDAPSGRYLLKFNNTMNRIEELLARYNDLPMLIDELSSMGNVKTMQSDMRTMVHHLSGVDDRGRYGDEIAAARQTRTIFQITANDSLSVLLQNESADAAEGVEDRIIEIPVPRGDEGVFNAPNPAFESTEELAFAITQAVSQCHGAPMPAFLRALVKHRADDPAKFQAGLMRRISEFSQLPPVVALGRVSSRKMRVFGLVYAAGELAKYYTILPREVDVGEAVRHCLGLHLGQRVEAEPKERLLAWFATNRAIELRSGERRSMSTARLDRRGAFIGECRGEPELWMRPKLFRRSFTNAQALLRQLKKRRILVPEGRGSKSHDARKRSVRHGKTDRVYVFSIADLEDWLDENGYPRPRRRNSKRSI